MEIAARKVSLQERVRLKRTGRRAAAILNLIIIKQCQQNRSGKKDHFIEIVADMKLKVSTKKGNQYHRKASRKSCLTPSVPKSSQLDKVLEYLDKYQVDQEDNANWPRHVSDTEDENRKEGKTCTCKCEQSQQKAQVYAPYPGNKRQSSSKGKICFGFSRDGFCKYGEQCKFAHTGHSKPINNFSQYRPRSNNQNMQARERKFLLIFRKVVTVNTVTVAGLYLQRSPYLQLFTVTTCNTTKYT